MISIRILGNPTLPWPAVITDFENSHCVKSVSQQHPLEDLRLLFLRGQYLTGYRLLVLSQFWHYHYLRRRHPTNMISTLFPSQVYMTFSVDRNIRPTWIHRDTMTISNEISSVFVNGTITAAISERLYYAMSSDHRTSFWFAHHISIAWWVYCRLLEALHTSCSGLGLEITSSPEVTTYFCTW